MSTTTPAIFSGKPTLTPKKVAAITKWYVTALSDANKSTAVEEFSYYLGIADGLEYTLALLHDMTTDVIAKSNKGGIKKPLLIVAAVGTTYYLFKNKEQIKKWFQEDEN